MKDEQLEKQFDEYFKGLEQPQNITADAKRQVKKGGRKGAKFVKFASVAACLLLVGTVTVFALRNLFPAQPINPDGPAETYSLSSLTAVSADVYADAKSPALLPVYKITCADNAQVVGYTTYREDGKTVIVRADIVVLKDGRRQDAVMYIDLSDKICEELKFIDGGETKSYYSVDYRYLMTYDNGEPVTNFSVTANQAKYYVSVKSTDTSAYKDYLNVIFS